MNLNYGNACVESLCGAGYRLELISHRNNEVWDEEDGAEDREGIKGEGRSRQEDVVTSCCPGWAQPKQTPSPFPSQPCRSGMKQVRIYYDLKHHFMKKTDLKEDRHEPRAKSDILKVSMGGLEASDFMAEGARQVYESAIEAGGK
jgi:hypothetical protein